MKSVPPFLNRASSYIFVNFGTTKRSAHRFQEFVLLLYVNKNHGDCLFGFLPFKVFNTIWLSSESFWMQLWRSWCVWNCVWKLKGGVCVCSLRVQVLKTIYFFNHLLKILGLSPTKPPESCKILISKFDNLLSAIWHKYYCKRISILKANITHTKWLIR